MRVDTSWKHLPESAKAVKSAMTTALENQGLPTNPEEIVGRKFMFFEGDHCVVGKVRALGFAPKEGVTLYVNTPRFKGGNIQCLKFIDDRCRVIIPDHPPIEGELVLLRNTDRF